MISYTKKDLEIVQSIDFKEANDIGLSVEEVLYCVEHNLLYYLM